VLNILCHHSSYFISRDIVLKYELGDSWTGTKAVTGCVSVSKYLKLRANYVHVAFWQKLSHQPLRLCYTILDQLAQ